MHIEKYGITQVAKLYQHYFREHITDNVDTTKTEYNQTWYEDNVSDYFNKNGKEINSKTITEYINNYISQNVKRKIRSDSVIMCTLIITQPKEYGTELNQDFFDKCIDAFDKHYLHGNAISISIHQDEEGQPHCHLSFIPITKDGRLSAKDYIGIRPNKKGQEPIINLNKFHEQMEQYTGYKLTSEDKIKKDLTMKEYKKQQEELKQAKEKNNNEIIKLQDEISKQKLLIDNYNFTFEDNNKKINIKKDDIKEQEKEIEELKQKQKENEITISKENEKAITQLTNFKIKKNDGKIKWQDMELIDLKKDEKLTEPPMKKSMLGGKIIDNDKINEWLKTTNEKIKNIWEHYIYNLSSMQMKNKILDKKLSEIIKDKKDIESTKTENIKLKTENDTLKKFKWNYDNLSVAYNKLDNAIDRAGVREQVEEELNRPQRPNQNQGYVPH